MRYLKMFNEMFDVKVADMHHTPSSRKQFGLDKNDEEGFQKYLTNKEENEVCSSCDCIPCQCTGDETYDEDLKEGLDDHFRDVRVNSYLKIARDKYKGKSSDEIVNTIDKGNPELRFMDDKEKDLFRNAWEKENTKGTFKYFMSLSDDELKQYQDNFSHHNFENPAEHSPEFVAWKKACQLKKIFVEPKEDIRVVKDNNYSRGIIH